jgi:hypothetical protein
VHLTQRSAFWTTPGDTARDPGGLEHRKHVHVPILAYLLPLFSKARKRNSGPGEKWFWLSASAPSAFLSSACSPIGGHLVSGYPFWYYPLRALADFLFRYSTTSSVCHSAIS